MQALSRLINILIDLALVLLNQRAKVKRDDQVQTIRNDPAGEFDREFGGVPVDPSQAALPSDQAGAEVDHKD